MSTPCFFLRLGWPSPRSFSTGRPSESHIVILTSKLGVSIHSQSGQRHRFPDIDSRTAQQLRDRILLHA